MEDDDGVYSLCTLCKNPFKDVYYSCEPASMIGGACKCKFVMCNDCYTKLIYLKKSELITKILNKGVSSTTERALITNYIDYIRGIYRTIFHDKTMA